jgi:hypothetical protein
MMKHAISLPLLPTAATAISCGGPLTKACLGETYPRYDPNASNSLENQAQVHEKSGGLYNCTQYFYDAATGLPLTGAHPFGFNQSIFPHWMYANITYSGSRFYEHRVNVFESFDRGGAGFSFPHDGWGTSSYEKDGKILIIGTQLHYGESFFPEQSSLTYPIEDRTIYRSEFTFLVPSSTAKYACAWMMTASSSLSIRMPSKSREIRPPVILSR